MIIIKREDIRWGEMGATYLYGSQITYHADGHVTLKILCWLQVKPLKPGFPVSTTRPLEASLASLFSRKITPIVSL